MINPPFGGPRIYIEVDGGIRAGLCEQGNADENEQFDVRIFDRLDQEGINKCWISRLGTGIGRIASSTVRRDVVMLMNCL